MVATPALQDQPEESGTAQAGWVQRDRVAVAAGQINGKAALGVPAHLAHRATATQEQAPCQDRGTDRAGCRSQEAMQRRSGTTGTPGCDRQRQDIGQGMDQTNRHGLDAQRTRRQEALPPAQPGRRDVMGGDVRTGGQR